MSMSDIVSSLRATVWPIAGLFIFAGLFLAIIVHTWRITPKQDHEDASRIPLEDEPVKPRTPSQSNQAR